MVRVISVHFQGYSELGGTSIISALVAYALKQLRHTGLWVPDTLATYTYMYVIASITCLMFNGLSGSRSAFVSAGVFISDTTSESLYDT